MAPSVKHLVEQALLLPSETRAELVEEILERSVPSRDFIAEQMGTVLRRMENVRAGRSGTIPAEEAHRRVRETLSAPP